VGKEIMSVYNFAPCPNINSAQTFAYWENGFSEEEIQKIIDFGESKNVQKATITGHDSESDFKKFRESKVSWINYEESSTWIYDRLAFIARNLNGQFFNYDLSGFVEDFQYTVYNGEDESHYDWHIDMMACKDGSSPRKLSLILQLSDATEYEGGELQLKDSSDHTAVERKKGHLIAFPSYLLHRVTPVTKGIRRSLVVWISGPAFR
jgi:PKHD-type hydroxylase